MSKKDIEPRGGLPFPWKCFHCGEREVYSAEVEYTTEIVHDGRPYSITIPALRTPQCRNCKTLVLTTEANRAITAAFRRVANLLTPEEIRQNREKLGLKQAALAERLEVGTATVSRWETGAQIQQRSLDKLLRLYFDLPEVRRALSPPAQGKFPHLDATRQRELRCQAQQFHLTASKHLGVSNGTRATDEEMAEATAGAATAE